jgi:hypothetical protein
MVCIPVGLLPAFTTQGIDMKTNIKKPLKAASLIGKSKSKNGKCKAILNWCMVMKDALAGR